MLFGGGGVVWWWWCCLVVVVLFGGGGVEMVCGVVLVNFVVVDVGVMVESGEIAVWSFPLFTLLLLLFFFSFSSTHLLGPSFLFPLTTSRLFHHSTILPPPSSFSTSLIFHSTPSHHSHTHSKPPTYTQIKLALGASSDKGLGIGQPSSRGETVFCRI